MRDIGFASVEQEILSDDSVVWNVYVALPGPHDEQSGRGHVTFKCADEAHALLLQAAIDDCVDVS